YRFVAGVRATFDELVVHESTSITVEEEEEAAPTAEGDGHPNTPPAAPAPRPHGLADAARSARRRRGLLIVVAALSVVGAATAFGTYRLVSQRRPPATPFGAIGISRLTTTGKVTHAAISPAGEYVAYVTAGADGDSLWVRHVAAPTGVLIAGPAVTEFVSVTFAPDGGSVYYLALDRDKGETALYRVPVLGGPSVMTAYDVGPVGFSPDGSRTAFIRMRGDESHLVLADADGGNGRTLAVRRRPEYFRMDWNAPAWSPDGRTIAAPARLSDGGGGYETVVGVSVAEGAQAQLTPARWSCVNQPAWLADGSGLLLTARESESAPERVWHVTPQGGAVRRVTHDLNDYHDLSLTAHAKRLAVVQVHAVSSIWVAPDGGAGRPRQVGSEAGSVEVVAWSPDGRIVYRSNAEAGADIWSVGTDGSTPKQLTVGAQASRGLAVTPDGRHIIFVSDRAGHFNVWRVDADGGNLTQLTFGEGEFYPHVSPDGRWVVYQRGEIRPTLWKVPTGGGEPVQLTEPRANRPAVSPDGRLIAYHYLDTDVDRMRWGIGVVPSEGGGRLKRFDFAPTVTQRYVRWSPDGRSIAYPNSPGGLSDIWSQPLDGGPPKRLTDLKAEHILAFDWSRDGRSLAIVSVVETSDVVLIDDSVLR
ncbi:MAG TPA: LpqB family beta-propeller domain-containing protein, partial [Pyrinomonadaceae bacterium]